MKPPELSINALAGDIDVPPNRISEFVSGKRAITADTTLRLGKYFGVSPEIWVGLQADYDIRVAKQTTWPKIEPRLRVTVACNSRPRMCREKLPRVTRLGARTAGKVMGTAYVHQPRAVVGEPG